MIIDIYFSIASGISFHNTVPRYGAALLEGRWQEAHAAVAGIAGSSDRQHYRQGDPGLLAMADVLSLLGFDEEAEDYYAKALRACRGSDTALRALSCRYAGWQALKRYRYRIARNCFLRIVRDNAASAAQRAEACIGLIITDHHLGLQESAMQSLGYARRFAAESGEKLWTFATELISFDLRVQTNVRMAASLADHAFWRTAYAGGGTPVTVSVRESVPSHDVPPIVSRQIEYLASLAAMANGDAHALQRLDDLIGEARQQGVGDVLRRMRIEGLLAAIAGGFASTAERLFNAISPRQREHRAARHVDLDHLYASAKIAAMRGEMGHAFAQYTTYSHEALHLLRSEAMPPRALDSRGAATAQTRGDDVSARLPAKYRRAYRYIVENIGRRTLTTREAAASIEVTERALQIVFKRSLGMTPGAVIRRVRMEGIRNELMDETGSYGTVIETASRWGMASRSALTRTYRKYFNESPTKAVDD